MTYLVIDGSIGEGGGQIMRTALTLSLCTRQPIEIKRIRAGRSKPGLLRQHLATLQAAAEISSAHVDGDELGSTEFRFAPETVTAGSYEFRIGSAGSTTLLAQTILPALAMQRESSTVTIFGGTHNGMAPSVDFMELAFLPMLAQMGLQIQSTLHQHGFYPTGGGCWQIDIAPWNTPAPLCATSRGELLSREAVATVSNLGMHIAQRELAKVAKKLNWHANELFEQAVPASGPGNVVSLRHHHEGVTEVFEAVGKLGVSAERVAGRAIRDSNAYSNGRHAIGEHLADQLLLPMVLGAGGEFTTGLLSSHSRTNMFVINEILGAQLFECFDIETDNTAQSVVKIPRGLALAR